LVLQSPRTTAGTAAPEEALGEAAEPPQRPTWRMTSAGTVARSTMPGTTGAAPLRLWARCGPAPAAAPPVVRRPIRAGRARRTPGRTGTPAEQRCTRSARITIDRTTGRTTVRTTARTTGRTTGRSTARTSGRTGSRSSTSRALRQPPTTHGALGTPRRWSWTRRPWTTGSRGTSAGAETGPEAAAVAAAGPGDAGIGEL